MPPDRLAALDRRCRRIGRDLSWLDRCLVARGLPPAGAMERRLFAALVLIVESWG